MTTTVRSVRVELEMGIASYVANARIAGHETDKAFSSAETRISATSQAVSRLDRNTDHLAKTSAEARVSQASFGREVEKTATSVGRADRSIDKYSGRLGLMIKLAAGFGPALEPIAAIGIPAFAGLAAEGGFAAGALGATVLALRGVGDAVKALEKARLDPTVANVKAAQVAMDKLGPSAASLAVHLESLSKVRDQLQNSAAAGLVPGLNKSLDELQAGVPLARHMVREFGAITGDLAARGAADITSDRWTPFFNYLRTNARPILDDTASAAGHVAHALASIFTSTASDQRSFSSWLRGTTEDFDHWASRLDSNQEFQDFLAYARENGPAVADAVGSIGKALAAVVEAAAPLGGPTLEILTAIADTVDAIASSPLGTPLLATIQAYSLLSTVLPGVKKGYEGISVAQSKVEGKIAASRSTLTAFAGDLRNVARYGNLATESSSRLRSQLGPLVKGGAGLAGLAIATSGAADGMGLTNTASLTLLGTLAGPWGAALGGAVGLVKDFSASSGDAGAATKRWNAELKDGQTSLETYSSILQGAQDQLGKMDDIIPSNFGDAILHGLNPQSIKLSFRALFGNLDDSDLGKQADEVAKLNEQYNDLITTATILGQATGQIDFGDSATMEQLTEILVEAKPAMDGLGISTEDLMASMRDGSILTLIDRIRAYQASAESSVGKTQAVKDAIDHLDDGLVTTASSADALKNSLDALLGPQLGLSAATDAWTTALRHLDGDLDKSNHTLNGNSDAAIKNRAAIRDRVSALEDVLVAEAQAGASSATLRASLERQRQALIDAGVAAGISRRDMHAYLDTLGLTPALVKTLIQAETADATAKVRTLQQLLHDLKSKDIYVALHYQTIGNKPHAPTPGDVNGGADGMTVPGQRAPYGDKVLAYLAPGEEVISNRHGQADRFRSDRAAGRIPAYAAGGTVGRGHPDDGGLSTPLFPGEGPRFYKAAYRHNRPFALDGPAKWDWPYQTGLTEALVPLFEKWVRDNSIPFDMRAKIVDYDMRGFWRKKRPKSWHAGDHFPDTWKTPYDTRFSAESMYATADNPFHWHGDTLIDDRNGQVIAAADGGTVPGARTPYRDKVLVHAAPGEEIISNRHGQADRFRADRASGRIPAYAAGGTVEDRIQSTYTTRYRGYADGGTVDPSSGSSDSSDSTDKKPHKKPRPSFTAFLPQDVADSLDGVKDAAHRLDRALKGLQTAADKVKASYDAEKSKLDDLISQRDSTASSIASAAVHDPFGNGVAGLDAQVAADTGDIDAMTAALATLVNNGLDPKSALYQQLAASMDVNTAQQLAALSAGDLQSRASAFQHRSDEAAVLGGTVAGQALNGAITDQTKATRELRGTLKDLQNEIRSIGEQVHRGARDGSKEGARDGSREGSEAGTRAGREDASRSTAAAVRAGGRRR